VNDFDTCSTIFEPISEFWLASSISTLVFFAASPLRNARFFTSSATTANPFPASPARAASTAAFSAKRLVWKAISSIVLIILLVSSDDFNIDSIAVFIFAIAVFPSSTACTAKSANLSPDFALSALLPVKEFISSKDDAISSSDEACSDVASAKVCEPELISPEAEVI
jgi:hypothetical protein